MADEIGHRRATGEEEAAGERCALFSLDFRTPGDCSHMTRSLYSSVYTSPILLIFFNLQIQIKFMCHAKLDSPFFPMTHPTTSASMSMSHLTKPWHRLML